MKNFELDGVYMKNIGMEYFAQLLQGELEENEKVLLETEVKLMGEAGVSDIPFRYEGEGSLEMSQKNNAEYVFYSGTDDLMEADTEIRFTPEIESMSFKDSSRRLEAELEGLEDYRIIFDDLSNLRY